jgi:hypothetical protein
MERLRNEADARRVECTCCHQMEMASLTSQMREPTDSDFRLLLDGSGSDSGSRLLLDARRSDGHGQARIIVYLQHARVYQRGHVTAKGNAGLLHRRCRHGYKGTPKHQCAALLMESLDDEHIHSPKNAMTALSVNSNTQTTPSTNETTTQMENEPHAAPVAPTVPPCSAVAPITTPQALVNATKPLPSTSTVHADSYTQATPSTSETASQASESPQDALQP